MTGADTVGYKIVKIIEELYCSDGKVHTIAFLPHHRKMADSLLSVFTYACESDLLYAFWCPIDLYGREYDSPRYASVVPNNHEGYFIDQDKLELHHPEIYVIEYPYNGYNKATDIPHQFYTSNLKASGAQIVYIPYFSSAAGEPTRCARGLKNVDVIFAYDEADKINYEVKYPLARVYAVGSPKGDFLIPDAYKENILITTSLIPFLQNPIGRMKAYTSLIDWLYRENQHIVFRPHPLTDEGIRALRPEIEDYWHDFVAWACQRVKFSEHCEIALDFNEARMLYSDPSSVIDLWEQTGKPYKVIEVEEV